MIDQFKRSFARSLRRVWGSAALRSAARAVAGTAALFGRARPISVRYCTLFDSRYLTRGLVMLESLQPYLRPGDEVVVLAIDEQARDVLKRAARANWCVIGVPDLGDVELEAAALNRPRREFCWTCTPALSAWMVREADECDIIVYLDADLMFFEDPRILLEELADGDSVLIHEHRFSPDRIEHEATSGRFNVGFVAFRVGEEARKCVAHWRAQTIECCVLDPDKGLCGDQGYLTAWPNLYPNVRIMRNIGGGVAPWNVVQYRIGHNGRGPTVDATDVIFYHYHAFRTLADSELGFVAVEPAYHYEFTADVTKNIYRPYVRCIARATRRAVRKDFSSEPDSSVDREELLLGLFKGSYLPCGRRGHRFLIEAKLRRDFEPWGAFLRKVRSKMKTIFDLKLTWLKLRGFINLRARLKRFGYYLVRLSERGLPEELNLYGDRDVEWAWTTAHIREPAGRVLDLGPSSAYTPLVASFVGRNVLALDIEPPSVPYKQPNLVYKKGDILHGGLPDGTFDTIVNCSTTEHIGLSGRYGSTEDTDGDLKAMAMLRERLAGPDSRMIFTIPVGQDSVERPYHRIYGPERLPKVLAGFKIVKEAYFAKPDFPNTWVPVSKDVALGVKGSPSFYALGLFVLARA